MSIMAWAVLFEKRTMHLGGLPDVTGGASWSGVLFLGPEVKVRSEVMP